MIRDVAELLQALIDKEKELLDRFKIEHGPMIGDMYEGLTRDIISKVLPRELDLRVVEGKIRNKAGDLSRQIDCMVVHGEGSSVPHTTHFIYDSQQVIVVIEVKKTLYGSELEDASSLLAGLWSVFDPKEVPTSPVHGAWRLITRSHPPTAEQLAQFPLDMEMLYRTLVTESVLPVRIALGYAGYKSERSLRRGFIDYLQKHVYDGKGQPKRGFGPNSLPNLVVCGDSTLVKTNGFPYVGPINDDGFWLCMASRGERPIRLFLEVIWSRLNLFHNVSPRIFGDDLELEGINPLLRARAGKFGDLVGWNYTFDPLSDANFLAGNSSKDWEPEELSLPEFTIVNMLCDGEVVSTRDPEMLRFLERNSTSMDAIVDSLKKRALASIKDGNLELTTKFCRCLITPDGRFLAADDDSGRFSRWVERCQRACEPETWVTV